MDTHEFYRNFCTRAFALPKEEKLRNLEGYCRVKLPESFRRFVLEHNGGEFSEPSFFVKELGKGFGLATLFGCGTEDSNDLIQNVDLFDDNIPTIILPIGCTSGNSLLLLVTEDLEKGSIRLKEPWVDGSVFVAKNLDEFFLLFNSACKAN